MKKPIHVIPLNDLKDHQQSARCKCEPRVEEDGHLVVHNAWDLREADERDRAVCPRCGLEAEWQDCDKCGGDGGEYFCYGCGKPPETVNTVSIAEQAEGVRDAITILYAEALLDEHEVGLKLAAAARTLEGATEPPMTGTTIEAQIGHMQTAIAHAYRCSNMESIVALEAALATLRWVQGLKGKDASGA